MNCPACASPLTTLNVKALAVDACRGGCGGIWFDNFELKKVDEAAEKLGATLAALEFNPKAAMVQHKRPCPRCADITMLQHKFSPAKPVIVDECPNCGGMWLDGGELAEIRRRSLTADDRKAAAQRFFSKMFIEDLARLKTQRANNSGSPGEIGRTAGRATD